MSFCKDKSIQEMLQRCVNWRPLPRDARLLLLVQSYYYFHLGKIANRGFMAENCWEGCAVAIGTSDIDDKNHGTPCFFLFNSTFGQLLNI